MRKTARLLALLATGIAAFAQTDWKAGVAKAVTTPREAIWMAGFGFRTKPKRLTQTAASFADNLQMIKYPNLELRILAKHVRTCRGFRFDSINRNGNVAKSGPIISHNGTASDSTRSRISLRSIRSVVTSTLIFSRDRRSINRPPR